MEEQTQTMQKKGARKESPKEGKTDTGDSRVAPTDRVERAKEPENNGNHNMVSDTTSSEPGQQAAPALKHDTTIHNTEEMHTSKADSSKRRHRLFEDYTYKWRTFRTSTCC